MKNITLPENVIFQLAASHSNLAQAEYERNGAYNDEHPSAIAELDLIAALEGDDLDRMLEHIAKVNSQ